MMNDFRTIDSNGKPLRLVLIKNAFYLTCEQSQYLKVELGKALVRYIFTKEELKFIFESVLNRYSYYGETNNFEV